MKVIFTVIVPAGLGYSAKSDYGHEFTYNPLESYIGEEYQGIKVRHLGSASDSEKGYYGVSITLLYTDKEGAEKEFNWIQSYTATGGSKDTGKPTSDIGNDQGHKDNAPYYYSQKELAGKINNKDGSNITFHDKLYRKGEDSYQWNAELSLVNTNSPQKPIITLQYGFKGGNNKLEISPVKVVQPSNFQKNLLKSAK